MNKYLPYNFNDKIIKIPLDELNNSIKILGLTKDQAIKMYLEDNGYLINQEQEKLEKKGKENRVTAKLGAKSTTTKERKPREKKIDVEKENIIKNLFEYLNSIENITSVKIENSTKIITFSINENNYKLDLIKQRPPKAK